MRKFIIVLCLVGMISAVVKAQEPSLMRIAGKEVVLSEFLRYYNQTNKDYTLDQKRFLHHFVHYKLKVADASERHLDTLPDFKRQCETLQARILKDYFTNHQLADTYVRKWMEDENRRQTVKGWVKIRLYTYRLSQHAVSQEERHAVQIMDELYERLHNRSLSSEANLSWIQQNAILIEEDGNGWIPLNSLLKEQVENLTPLGVNEYSHPFSSPLGIHVISLADRKNEIDPAKVKSDLESFMDRQGVDSPLLNLSIFNEWKKNVKALPKDVLFKMGEIHDGLLAAYWDYYFLPKIHDNVSSEDLEAYFLSHKKQYRWEFPHFKGAVVHCLNKKAASKIKKRLKKIPMSLWKEALQRFSEEEPTCRGELECGLFQIGKNAYVDQLAFKCGEFQLRKDLPYTFLIGKKLKKGPEVYTDVLRQVASDYQIQRENDFFSQLFARFTVEINEDVLKTVNSCGNK